MKENTVENILADLDKAIVSVNDPNFNIFQASETISNACKFIVIALNASEEREKELEEELKDASTTIDALLEENDTLQVDMQIILEFLKENKIDISYIVMKSKKKKK